MSTFSELVSFSKDRNTNITESVYHTEQYSKNTQSVVDQKLVIKGNTGTQRYIADMRFNDFPVCNSEREAALKLASWMQRLGAAIEDHWSKP